ncbi:hypothetical protein [Butyrivibrio sp. AC2005]|uniref:hypothetical protein n=1 Tax=Butyrivibrio sp. AC2005 TaxID=1280672 RepID=UPI00041A894D|nr:hypothetical protein [Butyrivibrio sp. AC2005]
MMIKEFMTRVASGLMASTLVFCPEGGLPKMVRVAGEESCTETMMFSGGLKGDVSDKKLIQDIFGEIESMGRIRAQAKTIDDKAQVFLGDGQGSVPVYVDASGMEENKTSDDENNNGESDENKNDDENKGDESDDGKKTDESDNGNNGDSDNKKEDGDKKGSDDRKKDNDQKKSEDHGQEDSNTSGDNESDNSGDVKNDDDRGNNEDSNEETKKKRAVNKNNNGKTNRTGVTDENGEEDYSGSETEAGDFREIEREAVKAEPLEDDVKLEQGDALEDKGDPDEQKKNRDDKKERAIRTMRIGFTTALLAVGLAASGSLKYLWMLIFAFLTKKKRKKWHGVLTADRNRFVEIKSTSADEGRLVQDFIDEYKEPAVIIEKLRESKAYTYLPANTKMDVTYSGLTESNIRADENTLYEILATMRKDVGEVKVLIHNDPARINVTLTFTI